MPRTPGNTRKYGVKRVDVTLWDAAAQVTHQCPADPLAAVLSM